MTRPNEDSQVGLTKRLAVLPDDEFADLVFDNLAPSAPPSLWHGLLHPRVAVRTRSVLLELRADYMQTLEEKRAELDEDEAEAWSREVGRPLYTALTARLRSARFAEDLERLRAAVDYSERRHVECRKLVGKLAVGIQRHRLALLAGGFEPEDHDRDLWALLAALTVGDGDGQATLDEMIGHGAWTLDEPAVAEAVLADA